LATPNTLKGKGECLKASSAYTSGKAAERWMEAAMTANLTTTTMVVMTIILYDSNGRDRAGSNDRDQ